MDSGGQAKWTGIRLLWIIQNLRFANVLKHVPVLEKRLLNLELLKFIIPGIQSIVNIFEKSTDATFAL